MRASSTPATIATQRRYWRHGSSVTPAKYSPLWRIRTTGNRYCWLVLTAPTRHVLGAALAARASQKIGPTIAGIQHLGHKLQVAEARIGRDSTLAGETLAEAGLGQHAGVTVIGQWVGGKLMAPPTPGMRLESGGILVLVGNDDSIRDFMNLCAGARRLRRDGPFLIAGGGEVGRKVAQMLTDCGEQTFMIDTHPGPGVDLVGNVLDTQVLKQAGIGECSGSRTWSELRYGHAV